MTYTNDGETVLDNCIEISTTAVACINTNRHFIGFENLESIIIQPVNVLQAMREPKLAL